MWGALLDPFLDTWEDQETIDRQFAWLARLGLEREAVDRWRREVAPAMYAYNFGTTVGVGLVCILRRAECPAGEAQPGSVQGLLLARDARGGARSAAE